MSEVGLIIDENYLFGDEKCRPNGWEDVDNGGDKSFITDLSEAYAVSLVREIKPVYEPKDPGMAYLQEFVNDRRFDRLLNLLPDRLVEKLYDRIVSTKANSDDWKVCAENAEENNEKLRQKLEAAEDRADKAESALREAREQKPVAIMGNNGSVMSRSELGDSFDKCLDGNTALYAAPVPAMPVQDDKQELAKHFEFAMESKEFERYAIANQMNIYMHPLHYIFLDRETSTARDAWRSAMKYAVKVLAGNQSGVKPSC